MTLFELDENDRMVPRASLGEEFRPGAPTDWASTTFVTNHGEGFSILVQPYGDAAQPRGVVQVVWAQPLLEAPPHAANAISLLSEEIAMATERADLLSILSRRATTDPLTGMANRRVWRDALPSLMDLNADLCVALLDLDFFKAYNDTFGHPAGDALLQALGIAWRPLLRPDDLLVRWGGEEFALALPSCDLPRALDVLERLRSAVPFGQTVSVGVAEWADGELIEVLMSRVDEALYQAKRAGRDRIAVADGQASASQTPSAPATSP